MTNSRGAAQILRVELVVAPELDLRIYPEVRFSVGRLDVDVKSFLFA
jgi:hypothetical protein